MKRRDFLKVGSLFSASAYFVMGPVGKMADLPLEAVARGKMYRGTRGGEIYTSDDGGKNWGLHANFGPSCPIVNVYASKNGQVYADVAFKPHHFKLALAQDGKQWMTLI